MADERAPREERRCAKRAAAAAGRGFADEPPASQGAAARAFRRRGRRITVGRAETNGGNRLMDRIRVTGGRRLVGTIPISGAKNATLPLMIASLLTDRKLTLENVPDLADVGLLKRILANHGVDYMVSGKRAKQTTEAGETLTLSAETIVDTTAPYELVSRMRASFWVIGPLLARMHEAKVSLPGGCAIGTRPVDFFLLGLEALGARIDIEGGYVVAKAPGGLKGSLVRFPHASVGATHTILMAATLARGDTTVENAAREPEV